MMISSTLMKLHSLMLATMFLTFAGVEAYAQKLSVPSKISCKYGSILIRQVGPAETYDNTKTAAYTLTVNGIVENATGIESGNFTKVSSKNYYVSAGTGGLTFARHQGKPYFGKDGNAELICTNSKYGDTSPGFSYQ